MSDTQLVKRLKMSAALPSEHTDNGLDYLADTLVKNPEGTLVLAVAVLDVYECKYRVATGERVPVVRIQRLEGVLLDDAPQHVRQWLDARRSDRLGAEQLPYDDEDEEGLSDPLEEAGLADVVAIVPGDADQTVLNPFGGRR